MPVKCPHCGQGFKNNAGLATHLRHLHADKKVGAYKCTHEGCARSFDTQHGLHLHQVKTHGAAKKSPTARPRPPRTESNPVVVVNYCPHCGTNIQLLAHALAAIGGLQQHG